MGAPSVEKQKWIFQGNRRVLTEGIQPSTYMLTESRSFYNSFPPLSFNYTLQAFFKNDRVEVKKNKNKTESFCAYGWREL